MTDYQRFVAERVNRVPVSGLHKFFGIAASMPDVISLGVGEPDFATPAPIARAAFDAIYNKPIGYTANSGLMELREAVASHLEKLYSVSYNPGAEILITVGVSEALKCVFSAICNEGDEIIVPNPCFVAYDPEIIFAGGVPVVVECLAENAFEPQAADIRAAITPKTKAIFLGFPNNPTGAVLSRQNAIEIHAIAAEHDILIISDEIYDRLVYGIDHVCLSALPDARERTILLGGFSKDYAMTGWRVGYICANAELLAAFSKIHQYAVMSAPTISQFAALAALRIGEPFVLEMHAEYNRRRQLLVRSLNEIGLKCFEPKGAFYAFPSVEATGLTGDEFAERLLMEEQIAVVPGSSFGIGGANHVRIAYCKSVEQIEIALERIERFVRRVSAETKEEIFSHRIHRDEKIIVIGAGLGGLAAAIRLAKSNFDVTILEKNESVGGKVNFVETNGYKFDTGASLLTMRHVFEDLFASCGRRIEDYLDLAPLDPICRYFWSDGSRFDASSDLQKTEKEIAKIEPRDAENFRRYLNDSRRKYEIAEKTFLAHSLNDLPKLLRPKYLKDLLAISSLKTLDAHNKSYFHSAKLQQLFNRFATYNGSSPYQTPATFALVPFVEFGLGAWYARGGIYQIPRALERLAKELGAEIKTNSAVEKIIVENKKAVGVRLESGEVLESDAVVANSDAIETYRNLLDEKFLNKKLNEREPSCSGFVLLLGVKKFPQLAHHNIFFSDDYRAEFDALFKHLRPAPNPTIYVCATSKTDATQSPPNCENLFVLINAPYTNERTDWAKEAKSYRDLIIKKLENFGLEDLETSIEFEQIITPEDFETKYRTNRGSIYGVSSNGIFSALMRVPNKSKHIENLYFVGGATHPGGGMPLVLLSGKMAADLISAARLNPE